MSAATHAQREGSFVWNDHGRFVEVHPVDTGWLVVWGHYEDMGAVCKNEGSVTYATLAGARRRLADAALELTRSPQAAASAVQLFGFHTFPEHTGTLPEPL
ncbi:MAG TPA: hypothetical protein VGR22_07350 [Thermomicrobiales bacterium]|nr:hypothetical protein [Thermomicrobiales bacterium]